MKAEKYETGPMMYKVTGIEDDVGQSSKMDIIIQSDGDACLTLWGEGQRIEMEICTGFGGTHTPGLAMKLREVAEYIYNCQQDPQYPLKYLAERLGRKD